MSSKRTALVMAIAIALGGTADAADRIIPPSVPEGLDAPAGFKPFLVAHAVGTQNYVCIPASTSTGGEWLFIGPQATVFNENLEQILTHFQSKNPFKADAIHAMWQHSRDTSGVWATRLRGSLDPNYVAPGAIEWLLLEVTGDQIGPTGGDKLAGAKFIQRVNTVGGVKPAAEECNASTVTNRKLVYYEADYYFYQ